MPTDNDNPFEESKLPAKDLRVLAAVSYLPLGFVLPSLLGKGNEDFLAFHVRLSASFFVVTFLTSFVIGSIMWLLFFALAGFCGYKAFLGERYMPGFVKSIIEALNKK